MKCWCKDKSISDAIKYLPHKEQISCFWDTLSIYDFYGLDFAIKYWRELLYIDKQYVCQNEWYNSLWYISAICYCNVDSSCKELFDATINSFELLPSSEYKRDSKSKNRHFIYDHIENLKMTSKPKIGLVELVLPHHVNESLLSRHALRPQDF